MRWLSAAGRGAVSGDAISRTIQRLRRLSEGVAAGAFTIKSDAYLLERGPLMASVRWQAGGMPLRDQRRRNTIMLFIPPAEEMRSDPRFARLVRDVGLVDHWRRAGVVPDYLKKA